MKNPYDDQFYKNQAQKKDIPKFSMPTKFIICSTMVETSEIMQGYL